MGLHVRELRLRNYRSFRNARIPFDDVTFLVGRNSAGKSTIVDALDFVRDALTISLGIALERRGGARGVRNRMAGEEEPLEVAVVLELLTSRSEKGATTLAVPGAPVGGSDLRPTRLIYGFSLDADGRPLREICRAEGDLLDGFLWSGSTFTSYGKGSQLMPGLTADKALLLPLISGWAQPGRARRFASAGQSEPWGVVHSSLASLQSCHPSVDAIREGSEIDLGVSLDPDARNLSNVLWQIREKWKGPRAPRLVEALEAVVPGLTDVRTVNHAGRRVLEFVFHWHDREVAFPASAMSHGTLRALAILIALHQPSEPAMIAIDEIENSLHVGALQILFEEILARTDSAQPSAVELPAQVLLTTHSTEVLSLPVAEGRRIRIVEGRDGASDVFCLAPAVINDLKPPENVGRLLRINALWPDDEPLRNDGDLLEL